MDLKSIRYEQLRNLGNYENAKVCLEADISDGEDVRAAYAELRKLAGDLLYDREPTQDKDDAGPRF
jgi:hypothetical protein